MREKIAVSYFVAADIGNQPLGDRRISDFLGETADNANYCLAGVLMTAFMYFVMLLLCVCCSEATI